MQTVWTVGHSTREWQDFVDLLAQAGVEALADVRRYPASRRHPQFTAANMAQALPRAGLEYRPMPALGGRRRARADSPHTAWRNAAFRGYADYMDTGEYHAARDALEALAEHRRTAILCAEAHWTQCHRALISDDLKARGWRVIHLIAPGRSEEHPYTKAARIVDGALDYSGPGDGPDQRALF
ncbi:DUF488 domain-containing protein [Lysobacter sp. LF1]|uniref:DUF488 domain-containing protein n=1 Tax=Lysobacter stagni TaxID=3045172 RepID=A0ABT6XIC6_9GAMM|nr:DUF488 domain-containing protein [Lysobacter sp. LF1]MDI9239733.1 DUF488 domain-containing protein [Lysobacter sp. LF1]